MKSPMLFGLAFSGMLAAAPEADRTAWQWQAPVDVRQAGLVRLELPPAVLDVSQPELPDLRVVSPAGVETPYLIEQPFLDPGRVEFGDGFKAVLSGSTTVIEVAGTTAEPIVALELVSPAREFLKSVTIEANQDGGAWQTLAQNEVIFRQTGGVERLRVPLPAGKWRGFRLTVDDARSRPVPFTGVRMHCAGKHNATVELPVLLGKREEIAGETRLTLDLGTRNLYVKELGIEIGDAVFNRECKLSFSFQHPGGSMQGSWHDRTLYRVAGEHGGSTEQLAIAIQQRLPSRHLVVTIRNGDSPPLTIKGARVRCYPTVLVFHAAEAGAWQLLTGNRKAKAPHYDLIPLRAALAGAGGQAVLPGALRAKADYQIPQVLPGMGCDGVGIGLTDWSRRRLVDASRGVIRVELDAPALAACRLDLGDLRLVQNGRQLPYLVNPSTVLREMKPSMVALRNDPKRPTVSRWEVTLPVDGLPAADLTAQSPAPLFARRFVALTEHQDALGNAGTGTAGVADWTKSGGGKAPLVLKLGGRRLPRSLVLETDHGDNPPIAVDDVVVRFMAPSITAKITEDAALYLYYGNPRAAPPQYDLRLVRNELLAEDAQAAGLLDEEILRPAAGGNRGVDAGSPWLWLALGAVVTVLLGIVARLLPRPPA